MRALRTLLSSTAEKNPTPLSPSCFSRSFDEIPHPNLAESNCQLFCLIHNGHRHEAVSLFLRTHRSNIPLDATTISSILKLCGALSDIIFGKQLHSLCVKYDYDKAVSAGTSLLSMYAKCNSIEDARTVFDRMPERNVVTWTSLITGYLQCGFHRAVLKLVFQMQVERIWPNPFTFSSVLAAAATLRAIEQGRRVHSQLIKFGYQSTVFVCNSLINMYSKCGEVEESMLVFERMKKKDAVSWNSMVAGLVSNGLDLEALQNFYQMRVCGVKPTQLSFATVIKLCANLRQMHFAQQLHCCVVKDGYESDSNIMTALMVVYSKCNKLEDAYKLFSSMEGAQNVVSWTAIISGYVQNGDAARAAVLFSQMRKDYVEPNDFTYSILLTASPTISPFEIHTQVIKTNYQYVPSVGTALLAAYSKIGNTQDALSIFRNIDDKDIVAWSAMLACYAQAGDCVGAVKLFEEMARKKVKPNEFTLTSAINASTSPTAAADQGKQFHAVSIKYRYNDFLCVSSALLTMYARKGCIESAQKVFERQFVRDLVSWNSMVSGFAQHGYGKKALEIFRQMEDQGLEMDGITFIGVLTACTHAGLVEEGQRYFDSMVKDHQISLTDEHYSCMVDLYSRAGKLEEAKNLIQGMQYPAGATVWRTLLSSCRVHKNVELGRLAAEKLIMMEPQDSAAYVLLSNIYAAARRWDERARVRKLMDERRVKKEAGRSWIQVKNKVHSFLASDRSHPMSDNIYDKLKDIISRLKGQGYKPDTEYVLHEMEEEQKEDMLFQHSEKLALAFGLMATPECAPLQIVKNLRICGDCHTVIKMVAGIENREIVVRDSSRFHHFKGGSCSCGDYW